jgi:hypothetical protein
MPITVKCFGTSWNQIFKPNTRDYCRKVSQCCTIMPVHILVPTPLKASANWTSRCWSILHIILIWLLSPVRSTQRCFERPPFRQWPRSERSCLCVACHSTKNNFFWWHTEACGPLDYEQWKGQGLYRKIMLLYIITAIVLFNKNEFRILSDSPSHKQWGHLSIVDSGLKIPQHFWLQNSHFY